MKWLDDNRLVVANEGDYEGGSRGFTIFDKTGKVLYESGASLRTRRRPYRPLSRKAAPASKGVEPEGLEAAKFGDDQVFLPARRARLGRRRLQGHRRRSGTRPAAAVGHFAGRRDRHSRRAICLRPPTSSTSARTAAPRSHVMIYERAEGETAYPQIVSADKDGNPIGLAPFRVSPPFRTSRACSMPSATAFYGSQPTIYTIDATQEAGRHHRRPRRHA